MFVNPLSKTTHDPAISTHGITIDTKSGRQLIDLTAGTLSLPFGYDWRQSLVESFEESALTIGFTSSRIGNIYMEKFATEFINRLPNELTTINPKMCNGSDAVETAIKIAKVYTGRDGIAVVKGAWHGESTTCLNLSSRSLLRSKQEKVHISQDSTVESLIEKIIEDPFHISCAIIDPIGFSCGLFEETGLKEQLEKLQQVCAQHGILLVFDEIQSSVFTFPHFTAAEKYQITPDIATFGKAIGFGLAPIACVAMQEKYGDVLRYNEAEFTFGAQPPSLAISINGLKILKERRSQIEESMAKTLTILKEFEDRFGKDYLIQSNSTSMTIAPNDQRESLSWVAKISRRCFENGVIVRPNDGRTRISLKLPIYVDPKSSEITDAIEILSTQLNKDNNENNTANRDTIIKLHTSDSSFQIPLVKDTITFDPFKVSPFKENTSYLLPIEDVEQELLKSSLERSGVPVVKTDLKVFENSTQYPIQVPDIQQSGRNKITDAQIVLRIERIFEYIRDFTNELPVFMLSDFALTKESDIAIHNISFRVNKNSINILYAHLVLAIQLSNFLQQRNSSLQDYLRPLDRFISQNGDPSFNALQQISKDLDEQTKKAIQIVLSNHKRQGLKPIENLSTEQINNTIDISNFALIIFDMDGVILDSEPLWDIAEFKVLNKYGLSKDAYDSNLTTGFRLQDIVAFWKTKCDLNAENKTIEDEIVDELNILIQRETQPMPGVIDLIQFFASQDIKMCIASSSPNKVIENVVNLFDIKRYFTSIHSAQDCSIGKPNPEIFIKAINHSGVRSQDTLIIEDSVNGVIAAKSAQCKCVAIPPTDSMHDPSYCISDYIFEDSKKFLDAIKNYSPSSF